ncbi:MAG: hypothetical protein AUK28_07850 [Desulfobacterales bacterium CG2_30_60_27]|nr:MAG: hypothetical protein AUK28_07850 [Desulfobacterales bacterium CG2_30_60_27]
MLLASIALVALLVMLPRPVVAVPGPQEQVKGSIDAILVLLKDQRLKQPDMVKERRDKISAVVDLRFDFQQMAERALARHWKDLASADQKRFTDLFGKLVVCRYIGRIESYTDETVDYQKELVQGDKARVYTAILKNGAIPITYSLKLTGDKWLVYDVMVEGVSLVANYRSEFEAILNKQNFAALLGRVQQKICGLGN